MVSNCFPAFLPPTGYAEGSSVFKTAAYL